MCRNACSVCLYLLCLTMWCLFCGCWCEVWPVAVFKAAPCMWRVQHEGQGQAVKLQIDTQMLQPVISPETAAAFQFFLGGGGIRHKTYRNFLHFQIAAIVMKPQLRAAPLQRSSVILFAYDYTIHDFQKRCAFVRRRNVERESGLKRLPMLRQRWVGESCCTCQRPFVQLSLHSTADALHTLAGVKCCQAHLWRPVNRHHEF